MARLNKPKTSANKNDNIKFAMVSHQTENIGDEIQSIAARRFLPKIDYYIDREDLTSFRPKPNEIVKIILNGWYLINPKKWPPTSACFVPLLTSMHINQKKPDILKVFNSSASQSFLRSNGPVGARDISTLSYLKSHKIPAYFSGCLTLTLERNKQIPRQDYILAVDLSDRVINHIKKHTKRPVVSLSVYHTSDLSASNRFILAEYYLYCYQSAHCVIATRLHAVLPSLAFETPVVLIKDANKYEKERFDGLDSFVHSISENDFIKNYDMSQLEKPHKNSREYLKYRDDLIHICSSFTGYNSDQGCCSLGGLEKMHQDPDYMQFFFKSLTKSYQAPVIDVLNAKIKNQQSVINGLDKEMQNILSSKSWAITKPLRRITEKLKSIINK